MTDSLPECLDVDELEDWSQPFNKVDSSFALEIEDTKTKGVTSRDHEKTIVHFDLDCFYAQVEMLRNPDLRNKPLGIQQKNIVVTCNYPARKFGVTKLMYVTDAIKKCPDLVLVSGEDLTNYRQISYEVSEFIKKYTPQVERLGFDENFVDVSQLVAWRQEDRDFTSEFVGNVFEIKEGSNHPKCGCGCEERIQIGSQIASDIREALRVELGITCCAGVAHNKLLAKLVAATHKPNQQTSLLPHAADDLILSLPSTRCIPGIGSKMHKRLLTLGMDRVKDLQEADSAVLQREFGTQTGQWLTQLAKGVDSSPVVPYSQPQTLSDEDSFKCCSNVKDAEQRIKDLIESLMKRVAEDGRVPQTVRLSIRKIGTHSNARESRQTTVPSNIFAQFHKKGLTDIAAERMFPVVVNLFKKLVNTSKPFHLTLINVCFAKLAKQDCDSGPLDFFFSKSKTFVEKNSGASASNFGDVINNICDIDEPLSEGENEFDEAQLYSVTNHIIHNGVEEVDKTGINSSFEPIANVIDLSEEKSHSPIMKRRSLFAPRASKPNFTISYKQGGIERKEYTDVQEVAGPESSFMASMRSKEEKIDVPKDKVSICNSQLRSSLMDTKKANLETSQPNCMESKLLMAIEQTANTSAKGVLRTDSMIFEPDVVVLTEKNTERNNTSPIAEKGKYNCEGHTSSFPEPVQDGNDKHWLLSDSFDLEKHLPSDVDPKTLIELPFGLQKEVLAQYGVLLQDGPEGKSLSLISDKVLTRSRSRKTNIQRKRKLPSPVREDLKKTKGQKSNVDHNSLGSDQISSTIDQSNNNLSMYYVTDEPPPSCTREKQQEESQLKDDGCHKEMPLSSVGAMCFVEPEAFCVSAVNQGESQSRSEICNVKTQSAKEQVSGNEEIQNNTTEDDEQIELQCRFFVDKSQGNVQSCSTEGSCSNVFKPDFIIDKYHDIFQNTSDVSKCLDKSQLISLDEKNLNEPHSSSINGQISNVLLSNSTPNKCFTNFQSNSPINEHISEASHSVVNKCYNNFQSNNYFEVDRCHTSGVAELGSNDTDSIQSNSNSSSINFIKTKKDFTQHEGVSEKDKEKMSCMKADESEETSALNQLGCSAQARVKPVLPESTLKMLPKDINPEVFAALPSSIRSELMAHVLMGTPVTVSNTTLGSRFLNSTVASSSSNSCKTSVSSKRKSNSKPTSQKSLFHYFNKKGEG